MRAARSSTRNLRQQGEDEGKYDELSEQIEARGDRARSARCGTRGHDPAQQACAGAVVSIGRDGKAHIERDLLKPEDSKRFARSRKDSAAAPKAPREHSAALVRQIDRTAHARLAGGARATRGCRGDRIDASAGASNVPALCAIAGIAWSRSTRATRHSERMPTNLPVARRTRPCRRGGRHSKRRYPERRSSCSPGCSVQPQNDVLGLLAFCVAQSVDAVTARRDARCRGRTRACRRARHARVVECDRGQLLRERAEGTRA